MIQFTHVIADPNGIHARNSVQLVREAGKYQSSIQIRAGERTASARQLMDLMGLAARHGQEIEITVEGEDEVSAAAGMRQAAEASL